MKVCLILALLLGSGTKTFQGPSQLAGSIQDTKTALLVYSSNGNAVDVLMKGSVEPLAVDTHLSIPGGCCLHPATPSLSPDGKRIAYVHLSSVKPRREGIDIYDRDKHAEKEIFQANLIWSISWAPGGNRLAVVADEKDEQFHNLYLVDIESGAVTRLSHGFLTVGGKPYTVSSYAAPSWNGAGNRLAVEVRSAGALGENSNNSAVVLWNTQTYEIQKSVDGVNPAWSQVRDVIAFFDPSRQKCFALKPDGSEKKLLFALGTNGFGSRLSLLSFPVVWSPDGNQLIFHQWADADLIMDVYRLDLRSNKLKFLTRSEVQVVDWRETK